MRAIELLLPQVFALVGGTLAGRFAFPTGRASWLCALGYGYVVGQILGAVGLYLSGTIGLGVRFLPAAGIQGALCVLLAAVLRRSLRGDLSVPNAVAPLRAEGVGRWLAIAFAAVVLLRIAVLGLEATAQPLYPWDAWQQWGTKARVWFETGELKRFVSPEEWLQIPSGTGNAVYTDANPRYPPVVPLIQVWSLAILLGALGAAMTGQLFRTSGYWPLALGASYMAVSLPILDTHAALAGYGDLPLSVMYCLAFMAATAWVRFRRKGDAAMAILLLAFLPLFKRPGIVWALTFLPFLMFAVRGCPVRPMLRGVLVLAFAGAAALIAVHVLGARTAILGDSFESLMANLFAWENWHLLWYLAIFLLLLHRRRRWSNQLSVTGTTLGLGAAFLAAVFWGTDLMASIADATTLNRALLPLGPATCFFLALLVQRDILRLAGTPANARASRMVQARANGTAP
ncbi:MAG: hypothetical protein AUG50_00170 [Betaproteobacteria bacterium 13_1_20CM_3_63_8]|nr:MAG: hypothetical protein AUG50_00170 [Betaproteobacteria bacterium 13_1_20CM_3_63_8]